MQVNDTAIDTENSGSCSYETDSPSSDKEQDSSRSGVRFACEKMALAPSNTDNVSNKRLCSDTQSFHYTPLQTFQSNTPPLTSGDSNNVSSLLYKQYTDNTTHYAERTFNQNENENCWTQAQQITILPATATSTKSHVHFESYETPADSMALSGLTRQNTQVSEYPVANEPVENYNSRRNTPSMAVHEWSTETSMPSSRNLAMLVDEIRYA